MLADLTIKEKNIVEGDDVIINKDNDKDKIIQKDEDDNWSILRNRLEASPSVS